MDLFEYMRNTNKEKESPLAARLRPSTLDEVVGQQHIIGKDKLLYRAIKADKLSSLIFYGPPGTGKTTLAKVIANTTQAEFTQINATIAGKKDMEEVVGKAKELQGMYGKRTILFIDEIHRFNKGQQDYLLPFVEDGTIILIGATTENPYFEVNGALLSRSVIFELKPLDQEDIRKLILRAVQDEQKGMGAYNAVIEEDALSFLAQLSGGDARHALNAVELGIMTTERSADGKIHLTLQVAQECIQRRVLRYDKTGDNHYDTISAFIKSMRGSDPDAAVFYLAKMFRDNTFDVCLDAAIKDIEGLQNIFVTMGYDTASKQYILKLINLKDKKVTLQPEVSGFKRPVKAHKTSLVLVPGKENTPFAPNEVQPVETEVGLDLNQPFELEAASMVVYRFKLK